MRTYAEVFKDRRGGGRTFDLSHLAEFFWEGHARNEVLNSGFNGGTGVPVNAIHGFFFSFDDLLMLKIWKG